MSGTEISLPGIAGLYGKVPARGDFVSRRLDPDFIDAWDAWLQRVMSQSRQLLGTRWLECFLTAPVWRFVLPAGMFSKTGWVGLILPSVDRVGRYFPLSIAAPVHEESIDVPSTLSKALPWLDSIERLALEALTPELDLDVFDRRLASLPLPHDAPVVLPIGDDTVPLGSSAATFQVWQFAPGADERASSSLWMTRGGETLAPAIAVCSGLMSGEHFCALLDGRWSEHAWTALYCDPKSTAVDLIHGQGKRGEAVAPLAASPSSENATQ